MYVTSAISHMFMYKIRFIEICLRETCYKTSKSKIFLFLINKFLVCKRIMNFEIHVVKRIEKLD